MSSLRVAPRPLETKKTPEIMVLSEFRARAMGLPVEQLLGSAERAFRRVAQVAGPLVHLDTGSETIQIPKVMLPKVSAGEWLRFSRVSEGVQVEVDAQKSQRAEQRLSGLFSALMVPRPAGWQPR